MKIILTGSELLDILHKRFRDSEIEIYINDNTKHVHLESNNTSGGFTIVEKKN